MDTNLCVDEDDKVVTIESESEVQMVIITHLRNHRDVYSISHLI